MTMLAAALAVCGAALLMAAATAVGAPAAKGKGPVPIIFVHGNSGSAQQFETNAMRFTTNGVPHNRLFAYEYDTLGSSNDLAISNLDGFIASVKARTGAKKVDILAHSRGTTVMHNYLATPDRAASVRRYVNFDGRFSATEPGGVMTLAIWGEGDQTRAIGGADNVYFPGKAHTEVTTSRQAFAQVYEFLFDRKPETTAVVPEKPDQVTVRGRSTLFPNNTGYDGALLRVFEVASATGRRTGKPIYSKTLDAGGAFGPVKVDGRKRYEFVATKTGETTIHNYPEPFERDDHFYRVLTAPALKPFIETGSNHTAIAVTRMREWWGDQSEGNDSLTFNGTEVINAPIAPRLRRVLAVFNFDKNSDRQTDTSASLSPFNGIGFLTGVDNYMAASPDAAGTIEVEATMRGTGHTESINVPNWPSDLHQVSVYFKDYVAKEFPRRK